MFGHKFIFLSLQKSIEKIIQRCGGGGGKGVLDADGILVVGRWGWNGVNY